MHFTQTNINITLPKMNKVGYIANITNESIIGISETKLDETVLLSELKLMLMI